MSPRVVVTGAGAVSPVGNDVASAWATLVAGQSGIGLITLFDASELRTKIAGEVKGFDPVAHFGARDARRIDRYSQLTLVAAREAVAAARLTLDRESASRTGILIGTGIGGVTTLYEQIGVLASRGPSRVSAFGAPMLLADTAPALVAMEIGAHGPNMAITTACASGANAIGEAAEMIRRGTADVILAGGAEAALVPYVLASFSVMRATSLRNDEPARASRPFDAERDGLVMAEGAAVLVLEALSHAQARGAPVLAELTGYATTNDAYHITAPSPDGAAAASCMRLALAAARLAPSDIGYINAHGTSTPLNDLSETQAIKAVFGEHATRIPVSSTKSMTGHMLGAAGAFEAMVAVEVLREELLPPTINYEKPDPECDLDYVPNVARRSDTRHVLSNSFGFGGHNAVLVFSRMD